VRVSGRWLEAFGFKKGAKHTAIGVERRVTRSHRLRSRAGRRHVAAWDLAPADAQDVHFRRATARDLLAPV